MKNNPLAIICIFFCLGIWTAKCVHIPLFFVVVSCGLFLLTALASLSRRLLFSLSLSAAIFLVGILQLQNFQTHPANHVSNFVSDNSQKVYVIGEIVSNPEVSRTFYGSERTVFTFRVRDLKLEIASVAPAGLPRNDREKGLPRNDAGKWQAIEGLIRVTLYGQRRDKEGEIRVGYGDELLLQGTLSRPPGLRNPGGFNYRAYLANHNIFGLLKVKEKDAFLSIGDTFPIRGENGSRLGWKTVLTGVFKVKQKLHRIIYTYLKPEQAALLSAILLGERSELSQDIKDLFISTGTIHILAISGLHVGLIAFILIFLFKLSHIPRRLNFILTIIFLIGYALLSGMRPSVVRATVMAVIVLFGLLINRETKIYNSLGLAALVILIVHPQYLFDAGFSLSFISVISIVYFSPKIAAIFPTRKPMIGYLIRAFSVSSAAWIGIAPLTAYYFNIVSPVAVLANLIVIPLLFLVVSLGLVCLFFAQLWIFLGVVFFNTCSLALLSLTKFTSFISRFPLGFWHCPKPAILFSCGYYGLLLLLFNYKRLNLSSGKLALILGLAANIFIWRPLLKSPSQELTVTFLDIGHGDAMVVEFPYSGSTMLIDGGPGGEHDAGRWAILPFLWNKGINKIDAVVLSHPDTDHLGGLITVLNNVQVDYLFDNGIAKKSAAYREYRKAFTEKLTNYHTVGKGQEIVGFGGVRLLILHPARPFFTDTEDDHNNNSLVLRLVYKDVSFLFCGDIEKQAINRVLGLRPILQSTILKVPHHGSYAGSSEQALFQAVAAQTAVISTDRNNQLRGRTATVSRHLEQLGLKVYHTSDSGAVIISTDGKDVEVRTTAD